MLSSRYKFNIPKLSQMLIILSYFLVIFYLLTPIKAEEDGINFTEFDAYIEQAMQDWLVPGAAVAVVKDGKVIHLKTFGIRSVKSKKPVTPETIFYIASLTKGFTAALISRLVDEEKIQWEDKVRKYLPDFRLADEEAAAEFTIEDLLSHRSGLPGFAGDSLVELGWGADEIYQALHKIPLKEPFRKAYDYQNIFPGIAGLIAEKVTGKPLSELYDTFLFNPLDLKNTNIGKDGLTGKETLWIKFKRKITSFFANKSDQHHQLDGKATVIKGGNPAIYCFEASRGINASIADMATWLLFQLNDGIHNGKTLISAKNIQRMRTSHILVGPPQGGRLFPKERVKEINYGMGWFIHDYDRLKVLSHMGGMTGVRSIITFSPEEKIGIVILANMGGMRVSLFPEAIRSKFFDMYLKLPDSHDWSKELLLDIKKSREKASKARLSYRLQSPLAEKDPTLYAGDYENDLYGKIKIAIEKDTLYMFYRKLKAHLKFWTGDNFSFQPSELSPSLAGTDIGDAVFRINNRPNDTEALLGINIFYEGIDSLFRKTR